MSFFNNDFYKRFEKDIDLIKDEDEDIDNDAFKSDDLESNNVDYYPDNGNLEVNKRNEDTFKELMDNASYKTDRYWDKNNPVVKIVLLVLFIVIVLGLLYYIIGWINMVD